MSGVLIIGIIVLLGFISGEAAKKIGLPKVTGFILAGIILNPGLTGLVPADFTDHTGLIINIALAFIAFSVGGTLRYSSIKKLGREICCVTLFEAEFAFLITIAGMVVVSSFFMRDSGGWMTAFVPVGLLMGSLACPTDPSATLAVVHQYKAKGVVTSTIMAVAAFDDALGIINFSLAVTIAQACISHHNVSIVSGFALPLYSIFGAIVLGAVFGFLFNILSIVIQRETEGALIVALLAGLSLCFGLSTFIRVDELLAVMTMGAIVVNFNSRREKIFKILERYTEELIFVLFFTLSGMHLDFAVLWSYLPLVIFFIVFRTIGKFSGAKSGAKLAGSPPAVVKYAWGGLIPQGGIVIGLALLIKQNPQFEHISDIIISTVIGATVVHELVGPLVSKMSIKAAGELSTLK